MCFLGGFQGHEQVNAASSQLGRVSGVFLCVWSPQTSRVGPVSAVVFSSFPLGFPCSHPHME